MQTLMSYVDTNLIFDNSYARLPEGFYTRLRPEPVMRPELIVFNSSLAEQLGFGKNLPDTHTLSQIFSGNSFMRGADSLAVVYAGHQFGHFVPQLGDGRAILLGEVIGLSGKRFDIQLKGSGKTPYSRRGDGRSALGPVLREYIISEAMHALGVPTTRALAAVSTGESVLREKSLPGAILTRVAHGHIRVGNFEYFAARQQFDSLRILADYSIHRFFPELATRPDRYTKFIKKVGELQSYLVSRWMGVGFIHGVMNTDNFSVSGETIDYGPCAFMNVYHPDTVFSSIDYNGRYSYRNQAYIALWNMARFAEALMPLIHENADTAKAIAGEAILSFSEKYQSFWLKTFRKKLGLELEVPEDDTLIKDFLAILEHKRLDFTNSFRSLNEIIEKGISIAEFGEWQYVWKQRAALEKASRIQLVSRLKASNPAVIPRNQQVEAVIEAAYQGKFSLFHEMIKSIQNPYGDIEGFEFCNNLVALDDSNYRTFCGT